jgi:2-iminoacetate synthase ThiH
MKKPLFDDEEEFYINDRGLFVFTAEYLLQRGYCCGNGCKHCPFDYKNVINLEKKAALLDAQLKQKAADASKKSTS